MRRTLAGLGMLLAAASACSPPSRARAASPTCSAHVARATAAAGALLLCANQWPPTPWQCVSYAPLWAKGRTATGDVRNGMQRPPSNLPSNQLRYRRDHWCMWAMTTWVYPIPAQSARFLRTGQNCTAAAPPPAVAKRCRDLTGRALLSLRFSAPICSALLRRHVQQSCVCRTTRPGFIEQPGSVARLS